MTVERERGRTKKSQEKERTGIVMDDPTSSMVSYLCGLNALGSWPWSVLVHIIKAHEEEKRAHRSC